MDVSLWGRFTATERRERGAAHRVLIEPSLDDPCTASIGRLTLQLSFCFEVRTLSDRLVSSAP